MEAKDGSMGFDFWGTYTKVEPTQLIESEIGDSRKLKATFSAENGAAHFRPIEGEACHTT